MMPTLPVPISGKPAQVVVLYLACMLLANQAQGCECTYSFLDHKLASTAKTVVAFRLEQARLDPADPHLVYGTVAEPDVLKGDAHPASVKYSIHWCCGSRLEVGSYYAVFLNSSEDEPLVHPGNLLLMSDGFGSHSHAMERLKKVISGEGALEEHFGPFPSSSVMREPVPPPPICP